MTMTDTVDGRSSEGNRKSKIENRKFLPLSRRRFLENNAMGIGSVALACLLDQENLLAKPKKIVQAGAHFDLTRKQPHYASQATAMISLFQHGGPAHMDLTDPKPELTR